MNAKRPIAYSWAQQERNEMRARAERELEPETGLDMGMLKAMIFGIAFALILL